MRQRTLDRQYLHTDTSDWVFSLDLSLRGDTGRPSHMRKGPGTRPGPLEVLPGRSYGSPFLRGNDGHLQPLDHYGVRGFIATCGAIGAPPPMPPLAPLYWKLSAGKWKLMLWLAG